MGIFYAYAKNVNDNWSWRIVIVFASREVADEWWRAVSTSNTRYSDNIKRISPQFYTHDPDWGNITETVTEPLVAPQFLTAVFFTLLPDKDGRALNIIPVQDVTDHVSGHSFYIRSRSNRGVYWCCPRTPSGNINLGTHVFASGTEPTRFCVRIRAHDEGPNPNGTIMIGSDAVTICLTSGDGDLSVTVDNGSGGLTVGKGQPAYFKFSDLRDAFRVGTGQAAGIITWDVGGGNHGEEWELF